MPGRSKNDSEIDRNRMQDLSPIARIHDSTSGFISRLSGSDEA